MIYECIQPRTVSNWQAQQYSDALFVQCKNSSVEIVTIYVPQGCPNDRMIVVVFNDNGKVCAYIVHTPTS